jgi:hypothetical protein
MRNKEKLGFLDYLLLIILLGLLIISTSCTKDDDIFLLEEPKLELDGRLPLDNNGYYHLELRQDVHQTIHRVSGRVYDYYQDEPLKVSWDSNLEWYLQDEISVGTSNQSSYVIDGRVNNVIGPVKTMVGDTLILTGTIREYLVSDTIKIVLE